MSKAKTPEIPTIAKKLEIVNLLFIIVLFGLYANYTKLKQANLPLTENNRAIKNQLQSWLIIIRCIYFNFLDFEYQFFCDALNTL